MLVIAIDGSDYSSYAAPSFRQETKDTSKGWHMRMKLIGALVTGRMYVHVLHDHGKLEVWCGHAWCTALLCLPLNARLVRFVCLLWGRARSQYPRWPPSCFSLLRGLADEATLLCPRLALHVYRSSA